MMHKDRRRSPKILLDLFAIGFLLTGLTAGGIFWMKHHLASFIVIMAMIWTAFSIIWLIVRGTEKELFR